MANLRLKFVHAFRDRHGKTRHYFRQAGRRAIALPGLPGSGEFMVAYQAALDGGAPRVEIGADRTKRGTVAHAIALYFGSLAYGALSGSTKQVRRRVLEAFREQHGDKPIARFERRHLEAILAEKVATPHAAKNLLKTLRQVIQGAIAAGLMDADPSVGIRVRAPKSNGHATWSESDIAKFENRWTMGTRERLALDLMLYTGQRRSDIVRMGRQHVRGGCITVRQQKTGKELVIPLHSALQESLSCFEPNNMTFLVTAYGKPFTAAGFGAWFRRACDEAGLPGLSAHGIRKAQCRRLAEAGCTALEIAAISGHATLAEVSRYTRDVDQARLAREAISRTETRKPQTPKLQTKS